MTAEIILFALLTAAVYFVIYPFISKKSPEAVPVEEQLSADELLKINLLRQIKEIDFEREMGIISEEDYNRIKNELMVETGVVMKRLESGKPDVKTVVTKSAGKFCPSCGTKAASGDQFCGSCGKKLG